jgi:hypothetical protein
MRRLALAIVLAACTPNDADLDFPTVPSNARATSGTGQGDTTGDQGGGDTTDLDAGSLPPPDPTGDGGRTRVDGGVSPFLDAAPPDAAALLPDASQVVPPAP